jgi:hypothetical protein
MSPEPTEIQFQVSNKKKIVDNPDKEANSVYKYKFEAVNSDSIDRMKIKATKDFAKEEDTFSFRALATQKDLQTVVDEQEGDE